MLKKAKALLIICVVIVGGWLVLNHRSDQQIQADADKWRQNWETDYNAKRTAALDAAISALTQQSKNGDVKAKYQLIKFWCDTFATLVTTVSTSESAYALPQKYKTPENCENNGIPLLKEMAEKGDIQAQFELGNLFNSQTRWTGDTSKPPVNDDEAFKWYLAAASHETNAKVKENDFFNIPPEVSAMTWAGIFYEKGLGTEKDSTKAFEWYLKSAQHGGDIADVARMLVSGEGVRQDIPEAIGWLQKLPNNESAKIQLGEIYFLHGQNIKDANSKAYNIFRELHENGSRSVQHSTDFYLGQMYYTGQGVKQDYKTAGEYLLSSAKRGEPHAQYLLSTLYFSGLGVVQDYKKAYMWATLAAANGKIEAVNLRNATELRLSPNDLEAAKHMAEIWGKGSNTVHYVCSTTDKSFVNDEFIIDLDSDNVRYNNYNGVLEGQNDGNEYMIFESDGSKSTINTLSGKYQVDCPSCTNSSILHNRFYYGTCTKSNNATFDNK